MGQGLRFEAWTLPWSADFHRKVADIPVIADTGRGSLRFNDFGEGSLSVSSEYDRIDEIVSASEGSLIRVYDGTNIIHEWVAARNQQSIEDSSVINISGQDLAGFAFDRAITYPYDYPTDPTVQDDHQWGSGENILQNPGFENNPLPNGGFELGTDAYWAATESEDIFDSATLTATLDAANADDGSWYGTLSSVAGPDAGAIHSITGLYPGKTYTITGKLNEPTGSGDRFRAGISDASTATHTNAYEEDGYWWADVDNATQGNGASDGTWQDFTLTWVAASTTAQLVVTYADTGAGPDFRIDTWQFTSGFGVGLEPWEPVVSYGNLDQFRWQTSIKHSGEAACRVQGDDVLGTNPYTGNSFYGRMGIQQVVGLTVGKTYTAGVWIYHASGGNETFKLAIQRGSSVGEFTGLTYLKSSNFTVADSTWTYKEFTFTADVSEARFQVRWVYQGAEDANEHASPVFYVDDTSLIEGLPATTIGDIWETLMDDAVVDHASDTRGTILDWVDYSSFDATNDSDSVAWDTEIAMTVYRGMSYGQVLDSTVELGYEWRLSPKTTPSGGLTHNLKLYNPDGLDAAPVIGLISGYAITSGSVVKRVPDYTASFVEGVGGQWDEDTNSTALTNFGRLERYQRSGQWGGEASLNNAQTEILGAESTNRRAVKAELENGNLRPGVDFREGDTLSFSIPGVLSKQDRRVSEWTYRNAEPVAVYTVIGSRIFDGEAGVFEAVRKLLRKFREPTAAAASIVSGGAGGGGPATYFIASSIASSHEKELATSSGGFLCDGTNDTEIIQAALSACSNSPYGGTLWFSSGVFYVSTSASTHYALSVPDYVHLVGTSGEEATQINCTTNNGTTNPRILDPVGFTKIIGIGFNHGASGTLGAVRATVNNQNIEIERCSFLNFNARAVYSSGAARLVVNNNRFESNTAGDIQIAGGGTRGMIISNNMFLPGATTSSCILDSSGVQLHVYHNKAGLTSGSFVEFTAAGGVGEYYIHHNSITNSASTNADPAIQFTATTTPQERIFITDNYLYNSQGAAIDLTLCDNYRIQNNTIVRSRHHGMLLTNSNYGQVSGNHIIDGSLRTANTYDGIQLAGDSDENHLINNHIRSVTSGQFKYGINIAASTCDNNSYLGNRATGTFGTSAYVDSGTGTVNTWPAASAPQGDNLT